MDDLIVIILTLIIIVASVIGQAKKKPAKKIDMPLPPAEDDLWTLPGEIKDLKPEKTLMKKQVQTSSRKLFPGETEHYDEGGRISFFANSEKEIYSNLPQKKRKNAFPLKKAIIYHAILNRKYT